MQLKSRDDFRIALIDAMAEQGKDKLDIMVLADIDDVRMLSDTRYRETQKNGGKWRVSWDRILSWIAACGYEVHIELRKKHATEESTNRCIPTSRLEAGPSGYMLAMDRRSK
jgi:hypothetical protein